MAAQDVIPVGKTILNYTEMNEADQQYAIEIASNILRAQEKSETVQYHKDIAEAIKKEFDNTKGGTWHVVCGTNFGSFIAHETKHVIHFSLGSNSFLIWRHG